MEDVCGMWYVVEKGIDGAPLVTLVQNVYDG